MRNPKNKYLHLRTYNNDYHAAYLELADHPHERTHCIYRSEQVDTLIENYNGPKIKIDFDINNTAIGIEILYSYEDDEEDTEGED